MTSHNNQRSPQAGFRQAIVWSLTGNGLTRAALAASTLLAAGLLGTADYGALNILLSTVSVVATVAGGSLSVPLTHQTVGLARISIDLASRYARRVIYRVGLTTGVLAGTLWPFASTVSRILTGTPRYDDAVRAALVYSVVTAVSTLSIAALSALMRFKQTAAIQAAKSGLSTIGILLGASVGGVTGALLGLAAGELAGAATAIVALRDHRSSQQTRANQAGGGTVERSPGRTIAVALAAVATQLATVATQMFLVRYDKSLSASAAFGIALRIHGLLFFVPSAAAQASLVYQTASSSGRSAWETARKYLRLQLWTAFVPAGVAAVGSLLIPEALDYNLAGLPWAVAVAALAVVPRGFNNALSHIAIAQGELGLWVLSDFAMAGMTVAASWMLVASLGPVGAACGLMIGYAASALVLVPATQRAMADRY